MYGIQLVSMTFYEVLISDKMRDQLLKIKLSFQNNNYLSLNVLDAVL